MKKLITISLGIILAAIAFGADENTYHVEMYRPTSGDWRMLKIEMSFDSDSIKRKPPAGIGRIIRIDYVATSYQERLTPYQKDLDKRRWNNLTTLLNIPSESFLIKNRYYQGKGLSKEASEKLFHGYVVYYEESVEKLHSLSMNSFPNLMSNLSGTNIGPHTRSLRIPTSYLHDKKELGNITPETKKEFEDVYRKEKMVVEWTYDSIGTNGIFHNARAVIYKVSAGIFAAWSGLSNTGLISMLSTSDINDSTVIVTDLTGSMYPYYSQLIVWHALKLNNRKKINFVFFNDGDQKADGNKFPGRVGGIYSIRSNNTYQVYKTMLKCISGGNGGDCPENNFEAVLNGLEQFENSANVILISDNFAPPRDQVLLDQINVPIEFVMCGAQNGINPIYMNLAFENGGSIKTMEESIADLNILPENEVFSFGKKRFIKKKGELICLSSPF